MLPRDQIGSLIGEICYHSYILVIFPSRNQYFFNSSLWGFSSCACPQTPWLTTMDVTLHLVYISVYLSIYVVFIFIHSCLPWSSLTDAGQDDSHAGGPLSRVVVKMLMEDAGIEFQASFLRQAEVLVELDHANVIQLLGRSFWLLSRWNGDINFHCVVEIVTEILTSQRAFKRSKQVLKWMTPV